MSDAYVCDRCGETFDGRPETHLREFAGMDVDLCSTCTERFRTWLRNGGSK